MQKRGSTERSSLHHQAPERGEHTEKHQEPASSMIIEAARLLHSKLRQLPAKMSEAERAIPFIFYSVHENAEDDILRDF